MQPRTLSEEDFTEIQVLADKEPIARNSTIGSHRDHQSYGAFDANGDMNVDVRDLYQKHVINLHNSVDNFEDDHDHDVGGSEPIPTTSETKVTVTKINNKEPENMVEDNFSETDLNSDLNIKKHKTLMNRLCCPIL